MKVWLKRVLISLVVLGIVAVVGVGIFLLTFNPNAYKANLQAYVYEQYQRTLRIDGEIQLSLFPRIGLSVEQVSLSDRDSQQTFMAVDSARLAVAIWPLLFDRLVIDHVAISGVRAWLARNEKGEFNFQDLLTTPSPVTSAQPAGLLPPAVAAQDAASGAAAAFHIDIAGLDVAKGEIHYTDVTSGHAGRVVDLALATGRMTANQAFDVTIEGRLQGDAPKADAKLAAKAIVKFNPVAQDYSAQRIDLQVSGQLAALQAKALSLQGNSLAYNAQSRMVGASGVEVSVQGAVESPAASVPQLDMQLSVPQLRIDRSRSEFRFEKLAYRANGQFDGKPFEVAIDAPGLAVSPQSAKAEPVTGSAKFGPTNDLLGLSLAMEGLSGDAFRLQWKEMKVDATLTQAERKVQLKMSSPARWDVFGQTAGFSAIKGDVVIRDPALPGGSFDFPLIGSVQANLPQNEVVSQIDAVINGSPVDLDIRSQLADAGLTTLDLRAEKLNIDELFPQAPAAGGGEAGQQGQTPKKPAEPEKAASSRVDLSFLNNLNLTGKVQLGELTVRKLRARNVSATVQAADGRLKVSSLKANAYGGTLAGELEATAANAVSVRADLAGVNVGPLLADLTGESRLLGTGAVTARLQSQGGTVAALEAGLDGSLKLRIRDGAVRGINVAQTLREVNEAVRNLFSGQPPAVSTGFDMTRQTDFSELDADIQFLSGQGTLTHLLLKSPLLRISQGDPASIDLVNDQLDVLLQVNVVNTSTGQDGKALQDLRGVMVPVRISGPLAAPQYRVQWQDIGSRAVREAVEQGLVDMLSKRLGEGQGAGAQGGTQPAPPPASPAEAVKNIGDTLKGLLGR